MRGEPLIGRERELASLLAAVERACSGRLTVALVSGEPGIGKSRLLAEAALRASARGLRVVAGYALDGGGLPALQPLRSALGEALAADQEDDSSRGLRLAVLSEAGIAAPHGAPPPALSAEAARLRLHEAFADELDNLARRTPVLLVLDDMQWADRQCWDLLVFAARRLTTSRVGFLLACREDALQDVASPAAAALVDLSRLRLLDHVSLEPLAAADVLRLATLAMGASPDVRLAERLVERSGGNPFFVEELSRALAEHERSASSSAADASDRAETALPLTLRLAVQQRLDRLPPESREALLAAAMIGRFAEVALIGDALGLDRDAVDALLAPALNDGLMRFENEHVVFGHDVIREALLERGIGQRRRLHAAIATAIESRIGADATADALATLAVHWSRADEPMRAGGAALAAAEAAWASRQPQASAEHARLAVTNLRRDAASGANVRAHAGYALGRAALANGDYVQSEQALRSALMESAAAQDPVLVGRLWLELGRLLRRREQHEPAAQALRQALATFEAGDALAEGAIEPLIELAGIEGMSRGRFAEAIEYGTRALDLAARRAAPALESRAALVLADVRGRAGEPTAARPLLERAADRALAAGDLTSAVEAAASLANVCYWSGDLRASRAFAELRLRLALESADPFALRHAHSWLALLAWTRGELPEAEALLNAARPRLQHLESPEPLAFARLVEGMIAFRRGDTAKAVGEIHDACALFASVDAMTPIWYAGWEGLVLVTSGREDEAAAVVEAQEQRLATLPEDALAARSARTTLALIYAFLGDRDGAARCEAALQPFADDFHWTSTRRSLAALAALRGDTATALQHLTRAERLARGQAALPELALTLLARADLLPPGDGDAERCRREAQRIVDRTGASIPERPRNASAPPRGRDGLSAREVEVLRLVAQGKTNREIAGELVLSERTVINHLSHIFTKIDAPNRSTATAYALRHGIA